MTTGTVANCTIDCIAHQVCVVCRRRKAPRGRSVPLEMTNGLCTDACEGYRGGDRIRVTATTPGRRVPTAAVAAAASRQRLKIPSEIRPFEESPWVLR